MTATIPPTDRMMSVMTGADGNDRHSIIEEWKTFMHKFVIANSHETATSRRAESHLVDFRRRRRGQREVFELK